MDIQRSKIANRNFIIVLILFLGIGVSAQSKIGEWKSLLPYNSGLLVTQSPEKIIYATQWALIIVDKEDLSHEFFSKTDGLSDIGISQINYDKSTESLIIAYSNSNIDIFRNDGIINFSQIKDNTAIAGDKSINAIYSHNGKCYFSTGFGLTELNLRTLDFGFTCFTGIPVKNSIIYNNELIMATDEGLYHIDTESILNLGDFNNWVLFAGDIGLPDLYNSNLLAEYNNLLYANIDNQLMRTDLESAFSPINFITRVNQFISLSSENEHLLIGYKGSNNQNYLIVSDGELELGIGKCVSSFQNSIEDQYEKIWYASKKPGLHYSESRVDNCKTLLFNSPYTSLVSDLALKDGTLYVSGGGVSENFNYLYNGTGFYLKENNTWQNFTRNNTPFLKDNNLFNIFRITPHPSLNTIYAGTYWGGIFSYDLDAKVFKLYNDENSSLQGAVGDSQRERIAGLVFDKNENLWISNYLANKPLSVMTSEGDWKSFRVGNNTKLANIIVDNYDNKWVRIQSEGGGVLVYNHGDDILNTSDDQYIILNSSNSELETNTITDIDIDKNGQIWVGTNKGAIVFDCGANIFGEDECTGNKIFVVEDNFGATLLEDVEIRSIEIDGADRKWFGTRKGIFVQDESAKNQIHYFTVDNSPLFADNIIDLAYDGKSGLMYIASDDGIQSYRTETLDGNRSHSSNIVVFPNPIHPEYTGPIAIKGLPENANVIITDVNGNMLHETSALGGQAIWDGNNLSGERIQSGIYLIFTSTTDSFYDSDSHVAKILVLR